MPSCPPGVSTHKPRLRSVLLLALVGMAGMHAWVFFSLRQEVRQGYPDFTAFYAAGKCVQRGLGPQLYSIPTQASIQQEFASGVKIRNGPLPFTHPPFEAAVFAPLAFLAYSDAYWVWNAASFVALLLFLLLLRPHIPKLRGWSEGLPFLCGLAFFPVFVCLLQGQDSLLLLLLFGLAFAEMKGGCNFVAGICLGLALFRFQLVLPVMAVLLLRRRWKTVAGFAITGAALVGISAAVVGWGELMNYPHRLLEFSHAQAAGAMNPRIMPNLRGVVAGLAGDGNSAHLLLGVLSLALVAWAAWKWKADGRQPEFGLGFGLTLVVSVIVSYHLMAHDLSVLLLPLLLAAEWLMRERPQGVAHWLTVTGIGTLFLSPVYFLLWFRYQRFSVMFWAVALLGAGLSLAFGLKDRAQLSHAAGNSG
ncbi:MAG TPA: glycosyltransferase family 87 protein [Terriglobales bacterium]|nr:glycosyltransferase family 87 protein [Terriglobales bacterium]